MNVHHLELFYYVARHGGIAEAVRRIPWGIQQPAVSSQISQLERDLGVILFRRRPFALTSHGEELYRFAEPFFSNLQTVARRIRGSGSELVRIAAAAPVLRYHLPNVLRTVQQRFPELRFTLHEATPEEIERLFELQAIDLAVGAFAGSTPGGMKSLKLLELPLALVVQAGNGIGSPADLWKQDPIESTLITLPAQEPICRAFQNGLNKLGVSWTPGIEVNSLDLIETYVESGFGIGLSVAGPVGKPVNSNVRCIPLNDFPSITVSALWNGVPSTSLKALIEMIEVQAKLLRV